MIKVTRKIGGVVMTLPPVGSTGRLDIFMPLDETRMLIQDLLLAYGFHENDVPEDTEA